MKRVHPASLLLLVVGLFLGNQVAKALDFRAPPDVVQATITTADLRVPEGDGLAPAEQLRQGVDEPEDPDAESEDEEDNAAAGQGAVKISSTPAHWQVNPELKRTLESIQPSKGVLSALRGSARVATSLNADLQLAAERILKDYNVKAGAIVMMEPSTGRLLAVATRTEDGSYGRELAAVPMAPAASVFKIVTGSALLERGVPPTNEVCYSGGLRRVQSRDLKANPRRDRRCVTFSEAMAKSANIPFARMTQDYLTSADLGRWATRYGFNQVMPFGMVPSPANIPSEPGLPFAATGAGFGDVRMSALHGAMLVSTVANGGKLVTPSLWADQEPPPATRILNASQVGPLREMLERAVTEGTARKGFRERGRYALGTIPAAGKTGSLWEHGPFRDFTWFVGYAPANNPTVVVSTFIMNGEKWRVRAPYVGREMLRTAMVKGHQPYRPLPDMAHR